MNTLNELKNKAKAIVEKVSDFPEERYALREKFYKTYGNSYLKGKSGLGHSELAFIKWEIKRGVLNAIQHGSKPGSHWWRTVNSHFLYVSTLAALIVDAGQTFEDLPEPVVFWMDFIERPNESTWYRAHNSSIISGYNVADQLALKENIYEQYFINIVLYRVLYAQSMVEGSSCGILGKIFGNPRGEAVSLITDIASFYPSHYPLSQKDIAYVTHKAHNLSGILEDVFDKIMVLPRLNALYTKASAWNSSTIILSYINDNQPIYPISDLLDDSLHFTSIFNTKTLQISN